MADYAPPTLTCLIEGESSPFSVKPITDIGILGLKDLIREKGINAAEHDVLAKDLILWKVDLVDPPDEELSGLTGKRVENSSKLKWKKNISEYWPAPDPNPDPNHIHIIVEVERRSVSGKTLGYWPAVSITVSDRGSFGDSSTLRNNNIFELRGAEPDFLVEFRTRLTQRRWVDAESDASRAFDLRKILDDFDNYFQESAMDGGQSGRVCSNTELCHFSVALLSVGWKDGNGCDIKEANVRWVFDSLGSHFQSVLERREKHSFRGDWPFSLIVDVGSDLKRRRYTPRSDFHIAVDRLVHLMVEFQLDRDEKDRHRMLLQGACAARLGRKIYGRPFVVMALYIRNTGSAIRYFLFEVGEGDNAKVYYVSDIQHWAMSPLDLFKAIFEMYNLLSFILSDRPELPGTVELILSLTSDVKKAVRSTFTSKRTHSDTGEGGTGTSSKKRSHRGQGGNTGNVSRHGEHVYHDRQVVDAFTRAGYELESNDEDEDGWELMNKLKPTMRYAKQSGGISVVVKKLRPKSKELSILRHLHSFALSHNYILPLAGALKLDVGTFIVLPIATSLEEGLAFDKGADFSGQLINGIAYLHRCGIAHLDIKPKNTVVFKTRLLIIDFDISVHVSGSNALIDRWCGTPGWMAPEIGQKDGPSCWYSPIRADLWSCGLVLEYLASIGASIGRAKWNAYEGLTRELLNEDPRHRPLLDRQSSGRGNLLRMRGLKRKSNALPHDAKRGRAINDVHI